jgi:hypothetical protein
MGTATYFSPEQAQGAQPDPRSDLYSLGIVLYEMVAGRRRSPARTRSASPTSRCTTPQPLNQLVADVPRPFEAIVAKLLAKKPEMRYPTPKRVRDDLRRFRNGEPVQALASAMGAAPGRHHRSAAYRAAGGHRRPAAHHRDGRGARHRARCRAPAPSHSSTSSSSTQPRWPRRHVRRHRLPRPHRPRRRRHRAVQRALEGRAAQRRSRCPPSPGSTAGRRHQGAHRRRPAGQPAHHRQPDPTFPRAPSCAPSPLPAPSCVRGQAVTVFYNPVKTPFALDDMAGKTQQEAVDLPQQARAWCSRPSSPRRTPTSSRQGHPHRPCRRARR